MTDFNNMEVMDLDPLGVATLPRYITVESPVGELLYAFWHGDPPLNVGDFCRCSVSTEGEYLIVAGLSGDSYFNPLAIDHGGLEGLDDDDHSQYWNDTRGDAAIATHTADDDAHHAWPPDWSDVVISTVGSPTYDRLDDLISSIQSSGMVSGGEVTDNGDGTIDVAAGVGFIRTGASDQSTLMSFEWSAASSLALTAEQLNYVYVGYNGGSPAVAATIDLSTVDSTSQFVIALVFAEATHAHYVPTGQRLHNFIYRFYLHSYEHDGIQRASGLVTSETGTRNLAITAGVLYWALQRITTDAFDSSGADRFDAYYRDGGGGWTEVDDQAPIDNTYYDDGSGTLAALISNRYGVHWVFMTPDSDVYVLYGRGSYTLSEAEAATVPATMPAELSDFAVLIAKIVIQEGASSFTEITLPWVASVGLSGATDHGGLSGLTDDDHSQYLNEARHAALDANVHSSGAATDGQVLTSDGAGNAAWEDAAGGGGWPVESTFKHQDGTEYATFALLLAALAANDMGLIGPGTHTVTTHSLPNDTHLRGPANGLGILSSVTTGTTLTVGDDCKIDKVRVDVAGTGSVTGINLSGVNPQLTDVEVNSTTTSGTANGIQLSGESGMILLNCRVSADDYALYDTDLSSGRIVGGYYDGDVRLGEDSNFLILFPTFTGVVTVNVDFNGAGWYFDGDGNIVTIGDPTLDLLTTHAADVDAHHTWPIGIDDLSDVTIDGTPAADELLAADGADGWDNKTAAEVDIITAKINGITAAGPGNAIPGSSDLFVFQQNSGGDVKYCAGNQLEETHDHNDDYYTEAEVNSLLADKADIDGDVLEISWNPTNYTPSATPSEASDVDDLTAHLYGIDQALASVDSKVVFGCVNAGHADFASAQAAVDYMEANSLYGIYFPGGDYDNITISVSGCRVSGDGRARFADTAGHCIEVASGADEVQISGLRFSGTSGGGNSYDLVHIGSGSYDTRVFNCYFRQSDRHGIYNDGDRTAIFGNTFAGGAAFDGTSVLHGSNSTESIVSACTNLDGDITNNGAGSNSVGSNT